MEENSQSNAKPSGSLRTELFLRLFLSNQNQIHAFILTLVPNWTDADDIMQEAATAMWRKFDTFKLGSNFTAWALRVAHFEVLKFRKICQRDRLRFNEDILNMILDYSTPTFNEPDTHIEALQSCLSKLSKSDSQLIQMRYERFKTTKDLANHIDRSVHGLYKSLARIHNVLLQCVRRTLAQENMA